MTTKAITPNSFPYFNIRNKMKCDIQPSRHRSSAHPTMLWYLSPYHQKKMPISADETMATCANSCFVGNYLSFFENQIERNNEPDKFLSETPNYFAWLNIVSEYILYLIRQMIYINNENEEAFDFLYQDLLNNLLSYEQLTGEQKENLLLFVEIRHIMVHKGFPNPHGIPSKKERKITNDYSLTEKRVYDIANMISKPKSYIELKAKSKIAINAVLSVTNELNHDFGWVQIRDHRER